MSERKCSNVESIILSGCAESYLNGQYNLTSGSNLTAVYELVDTAFLSPARIVHRIQRRKNFINSNGWTIVTDYGYRTHYRYFADDAQCPTSAGRWYAVEDSVIVLVLHLQGIHKVVANEALLSMNISRISVGSGMTC